MSSIKNGKRIDVWKKSAGHCWYCGRELESVFDVDHMIPISLGGSNCISNLFPSCKLCNTRKRTMTLDSFRRFMSMDGVRFSPKQRDLLKKVNVADGGTALVHLEAYENTQFSQFKFWFERNGL